MIKFKSIVTESHRIAKEKGFWDNERNIHEGLMLCITELSESVEAHRKDKKMDLEAFDNSISSGDPFKETFEEYIEHGYEVEIADTVIRLADLYCGLDLKRNTLDDRIKHIKSNMSFMGNSYENYGAELLTVCSQICALGMMYNFSTLGTDLEDSFASVFAKLLNIAEHEGFDLQRLCTMKMNYNQGREKMHGKKY